MVQWKEVMITTVRKTWEDEYRIDDLAILEPPLATRNNLLADYLIRPRTQVLTNDLFTSYISDIPIQWPREGEESDKDIIS